MCVHITHSHTCMYKYILNLQSINHICTYLYIHCKWSPLLVSYRSTYIWIWMCGFEHKYRQIRRRTKNVYAGSNQTHRIYSHKICQLMVPFRLYIFVLMINWNLLSALIYVYKRICENEFPCQIYLLTTYIYM